MNTDNLLHLANDSGGVLYVIAAMLFVALTVIAERFWFLQRVASSGHAALDQIDRIDHLDAATLARLTRDYQDLPAAQLFAAATRLQNSQDRDELDARFNEVIMRQAPRIDRFLWVLDTIVTLAPLLGLFGTIIGMFNAFQVLSNPGNAPTQVTGGVAEALIATASGLFVAMVGLVFFNGLHNRVRAVVHQLETLKAALVNRMARHTQEPAKVERDTPRAVSGQFASQGA
ncbi:outer membrane transport energization protein ExbB [Paraburkholderia fungorum]|uniref:Outer membrane transport energization protein ExbB n=1 Tax=Paraburkholderia fungorum TaxID=134537 RepID=A0A1H1JHQ2_9BURK|nr:MotA/TolQ/ExbB proton channel family protein [Paraburkholderia fungorum]SDR49536.1 outer membrane transport energization protein ExbB [Paraburkholderia fungorum]